MTYISDSNPNKKPKGKGPQRSSATRETNRWKTISVDEDTQVKAKEIALFRKMPLSSVLKQLVATEFDKVYQESLLLMRIAQSREKQEKERETQKRTVTTDRTTF